MKELLELLSKKSLSLGSVESMTGGLFASEVTSVPGASIVYKGSLITYQVSEKINLLKMDPSIIDEFGVVSSEVAIEMAEKGREVLDVDVCVSVTGNAGPTAQKGDKPVGDVCIAVSTKEITQNSEIILKGDRNTIRKLCIAEMVNLIKEAIK